MFIDKSKLILIRVQFLEDNQYKISAIKEVPERITLESKTFTSLISWEADSSITAYVQELKEKGKFTLETTEGKFEVTEDQVEVISSGKEGYSDASFPGGQVFIKTELTPKLIQEGLARDIIRRVQSMRKDANLEYTQSIEFYYKGDEEIKEAIIAWDDYIKRETQATVLKAGTKKTGITAEWEIDKMKAVFTIIPLEK